MNLNLFIHNILLQSTAQPGFWSRLYDAFFGKGNWKSYLEGTINTLIITALALVLGIVIGIFVAIVKYNHQLTGKLSILNRICIIYTTIIRGTPVVVQLIIINYIIFAAAPSDARLIVASLSFGINSGAYVSEIVRGGLMGVDKGQVETGRSLGLSQGQTMRLIIMPQAMRSILPSLFNEFISLLKETSVASNVSIMDITNAGTYVRSRSYGFEPFIVVAIIYLILVIGLTEIQKILERSVSKGDNG